MAATIVTLVGVGLTFLVGSLNLIIQWDNQKVQRDTQRWQREDAWITDRFTRAIEHLGNADQQVRIGAIFELEQIARDSVSYRRPIVSTLAAFVRHKMPESNVVKDQYVDVLLVRAPDAQAALTVLCRPPLSDNRPGSSELGGLDLSRTDLRHARLADAQLSGANLYNCHLEGADLRHANLSRANLRSAHFGILDSKAFDNGADIRHADLTKAGHLDTAHGLRHTVQTDQLPTADTVAQCKTCH
jgi:Pentapeptide repeats (8 copies)